MSRAAEQHVKPGTRHLTPIRAMQPIDTLHRIREHLRRLHAEQVKVRLDTNYAPQIGTLVEVRYAGADWHLLPDDFLDLVAALPDEAGGEAVKVKIERDTARVWHGESPRSRDTSP